MLLWSLLINILLLLLILYKMKKEIFSNKISKILLFIKNLLYLYRIEKNVFFHPKSLWPLVFVIIFVYFRFFDPYFRQYSP
jgi:hypothetical protein